MQRNNPKKSTFFSKIIPGVFFGHIGPFLNANDLENFSHVNGECKQLANTYASILHDTERSIIETRATNRSKEHSVTYSMERELTELKRTYDIERRPNEDTERNIRDKFRLQRIALLQKETQEIEEAVGEKNRTLYQHYENKSKSIRENGHQQLTTIRNELVTAEKAIFFSINYNRLLLHRFDLLKTFIQISEEEKNTRLRRNESINNRIWLSNSASTLIIVLGMVGMIHAIARSFRAPSPYFTLGLLKKTFLLSSPNQTCWQRYGNNNTFFYRCADPNVSNDNYSSIASECARGCDILLDATSILTETFSFAAVLLISGILWASLPSTGQRQPEWDSFPLSEYSPRLLQTFNLIKKEFQHAISNPFSNTHTTTTMHDVLEKIQPICAAFETVIKSKYHSNEYQKHQSHRL